MEPVSSLQSLSMGFSGPVAPAIAQTESTITADTELPLPPSLPAVAKNVEVAVQKLLRKDIYREIGEVLCHVKTATGSATGFCIGQNLIAIPFHVLEVLSQKSCEDAVTKQITKDQFEIKPICFMYKFISYEATHVENHAETTKALDCAIFKVDDLFFPSFPDLEIFQGEITPGEKVFFGGFPLTQEEPTFHSGIISSVFQKEDISYFTIDGTVVPGNSGGPVFIRNQGALKIIGIISQQVADFNPATQTMIRILQCLGGRGLGTTQFVGIPLIDGTTLRLPINSTELFGIAFDIIQRNLSTGIGVAISATHLVTLVEGENIKCSTPYASGVPVMRKERMPGMLAKDPAYLSWYHRHVKGQQLCRKITGRQIAADGHITPKEEKMLWDYYKTNPHYLGFSGLSPQDQLSNIENKILTATPKAMRANNGRFQQKLNELKESSPELTSKIEELLRRLG